MLYLSIREFVAIVRKLQMYSASNVCITNCVSENYVQSSEDPIRID